MHASGPLALRAGCPRDSRESLPRAKPRGCRRYKVDASVPRARRRIDRRSHSTGRLGARGEMATPVAWSLFASVQPESLPRFGGRRCDSRYIPWNEVPPGAGTTSPAPEECRLHPNQISICVGHTSSGGTLNRIAGASSPNLARIVTLAAAWCASHRGPGGLHFPGFQPQYLGWEYSEEAAGGRLVLL